MELTPVELLIYTEAAKKIIEMENKSR